MKYLYLPILISLLTCCPITIHADKGNSYLSDIDIHHREVIRKKQEVELKMVVDLNRLNMHTQHTVALIPVLISEDGSQETTFPPIVIDGKTRNKVYLRAQRLKSVECPPYHDGSERIVIRRTNGKEQSYEYQATLPYERWMLNGKIEIREQISGCANCGKGENTQELPGSKEVLAAFIPQFILKQMEPAQEQVKVRAETRTARLQFRQGSSKIEPDYKNNRTELNSVTSSINLLKENEDLSITGIHITGYASPEGSETFNKRLSQTRADALASYAQKDTHVDASLWHVTGVGEDWEGLRREVEKRPQLLHIDKVLKIIDECDGNRDACELRFKKELTPDIYQRLQNEMYGPLRRNEYRIEYNVRNFNIEEAKKQIKTRPDLLSVAEIYKVANSYAKGSDEQREAMLTAVRTYPDNVPAVVNAAYMEMELGDTVAAIRLLESSKAGNAPEVLNALGVAYAKNGQYDKAQQALQRAKAAGNNDAESNLKQIEKIMADL